MSQSTARNCTPLVTHSTLSWTPRSAASARPSSIWNPGGSAVLLANGSALAWAHCDSTPRSRMTLRGRPSAGEDLGGFRRAILGRSDRRAEAQSDGEGEDADHGDMLPRGGRACALPAGMRITPG